MKHKYAAFVAILDSTMLDRLFPLQDLGVVDLPNDARLGLATITKAPDNFIAKRWTDINGTQSIQTFSSLRKAKKRVHELIRLEAKRSNSDNFSFALRIDV
jgi:hypothetical protein